MKRMLVSFMVFLSLLTAARAADSTEGEDKSFHPEGGLAWMLSSAEFEALSMATFAAAGDRLSEIVRQRESGSAPWVVVVDADDTILSNLQFQVEGARCEFEYSGPRWKNWVNRKEASAVPGAARFLARVEALGGKVAVVTNRSDKYMPATAENMRKLGLSTDPERICFLGRSSSDEAQDHGNDKDARRAALRAGTAEACWRDQCDAVQASWGQPHEIVMYIGDNIQDFPGITQEAAKIHPEIVAEHLGRDWFLIPNSEYGSWEERTRKDWVKELGRKPGDTWANLSGLAADPDNPSILYAVTDKGEPDAVTGKKVRPAQIVTIDICGPSPKVVHHIELDASCGANLDLEGIAIGKDGHVWVVSEGDQKADDLEERRINLLMDVDRATGECHTPAVTLPPDLQAMFEARGFEGVATDEDGKVYVAIQSPLKGDTAAGERMTRILKYDPDAEEPWTSYYFQIAKPEGDAKLGLNELLYLGDRRFAVIERDDKKGDEANVKRIHTFSLPPKDGSSTLTIEKTVDLIDHFQHADVPVAEQIEGLAITPEGRVYVVTDNVRAEDTLLLYLGGSKVFEPAD